MKSFELIKTPDERLAQLDMPQPTAVHTLTFSRADTLVICAGFEDRAVTFLKKLDRGNECNLVVIHYAPFIKNNRASEIAEYYERATGLSPIELIYDRQNPTGFGSLVVEKIPENGGRVYVDVSAMSRLLIVQLLVALQQRPNGLHGCSVLYTEAVEYPPTQAEAKDVLEKAAADPNFTALFLSSGVYDVTIIPELSSIAMSDTQARLISFPAFDSHHFAALRSELQPSRFTFIEGVPHRPDLLWRVESIAMINHLDSIEKSSRHRTCSLDYRDTLRLLLKLYQEHSLRERLLVAPTGSKMQTVAVGIFRAFINDTQIVYPTPGGFVSPENYTRGQGTSYHVPLDTFSSIMA